jgi:hypothetical protein
VSLSTDQVRLARPIVTQSNSYYYAFNPKPQKNQIKYTAIETIPEFVLFNLCQRKYCLEVQPKISLQLFNQKLIKLSVHTYNISLLVPPQNSRSPVGTAGGTGRFYQMAIKWPLAFASLLQTCCSARRFFCRLFMVPICIEDNISAIGPVSNTALNHQKDIRAATSPHQFRNRSLRPGTPGNAILRE